MLQYFKPLKTFALLCFLCFARSKESKAIAEQKQATPANSKQSKKKDSLFALQTGCTFGAFALQEASASRAKVIKYKIKTTNTSKVYRAVYQELLFRGIYVFFCIFISSVSAWLYGKEMLYLYLYPLLNLSQNVIFISISEAFSTTLQLCISVALGGTAPFLLYGICCFVLPSLFPEERIQCAGLCFWALFFYIVGLCFCSIYIIPELCRWFLKFSVSTDFLFLSLQARISNYMSWSGKMYLFCVGIFEVPLIFLFTLKYFRSGPVFLSRNRTFVGIVLLLLCACISPPDLYSQGILFFFCIVGYEGALWCGFLQETVKQKRQSKAKASS